MPELTKKQCIEMAPENYDYVGYWDNMYHYQTGGYPGSYNYSRGEVHKGFTVIRCLLEDMTEKNLALMAKLGVTR